MTWNLIGHEWAVKLLRGHIQQRSLRQAYLITGPKGVGKQDLARRFIQAISCPQDPSSPDPCLSCSTCQKIDRLEHPDLFPISVEEDSKQIKIDQIRDLIHNLSLSPYQTDHRFGLLIDFQLANTATQNALLKTLEEPPAPVILILTAISPDSLLDTITSRCEQIKLNPVPVDQTSTGLQKLHHIPEEQAALLAHISGGKPVQALAYARDQALLEQRGKTLDEMMELLRGSAVDRFAYAEKISKKPELIEDLLEIWVSFWHDILLLRGGSEAPLQNIDRRSDIDEVLEKVDLKISRSTVDLFRRAHLLLSENANLKLTMEDLLLHLPTLTDKTV